MAMIGVILVPFVFGWLRATQNASMGIHQEANRSNHLVA
jgi:hypothetical protein